MAILPRTILTQPSPAAVASVALFGLTIMGTSAWKTAEKKQAMSAYESPCSAVEDQLGMRQLWEESSWIRYAYCFEQQNDSPAAAAIAEAGLAHYPKSETLYNIAGYNLLEAREHHEAVDVLERGIRAVETPTNGIMENNLAWAYLWVGDGGDTKARGLYQQSLDRQPLCETLHTGMFVEYEIARSHDGIERAEALRNLQSLRNRYQPCENRDGDYMTVVESIGAAVIYARVESMLGQGWDDRTDHTLRGAARSIKQRYPATSVQLLCDEAMPQRDLRDDCRRAVSRGLRE